MFWTITGVHRFVRGGWCVNGIAVVSGQESYRGRAPGRRGVGWARLPDVIGRVASGLNGARDVVAIELSIRGNLLGQLETPAGCDFSRTGAQARHPDGRFLVVRDGKIRRSQLPIVGTTTCRAVGIMMPDFVPRSRVLARPVVDRARTGWLKSTPA